MISALPRHYYLCSGDRAALERFWSGTRFLQEHGQCAVAACCPVKCGVNVSSELTLNQSLPAADSILRALALASGVSLVEA